ncbi:hypothetical protein DM01DRAFT_287795 [Hesseltinella vesiculosa]|uniref:FMP27 GFWDK domain-containing protein n=1 Tax=Hesseltinella vesiculosa TaxID=101127 RepID=A0A1X2GPW4_9FUNG|nr:hypothetical protein DM01DRAFT_287795 [Hesseltinella vesiculosa]
MIPLLLHIQAGETLIRMRDYPVPLLHIPAPSGHLSNPPTSLSSSPHRKKPEVSDPLLGIDPMQLYDTSSWRMVGNYVIADDLGVAQGKRHLTLPVLDNYTVTVVRTASPTKFYSQVDYHILTKNLVLLSWATAYQPAIQCLLACVDALLPLTVDPSPKPRFCDKLRLMIHTQAKISLKGGGDLCMVIKGTRCPYTLTDRGAGLALLWRGNVICHLGHPNLQQELLQIHSQDCLFGVPDLASFALPYPPSTYQSSLSPPFGFTFSKIAIKLFGGILMGIGCHLEPLGRIRHFKPHHHVVFKSPDYAEPTHDAYAGFRSHDTHLSFSIIQQPIHSQTLRDERNGMHLTPDFIGHFMHWYGLFGGALGRVPLRLAYAPTPSSASSSFPAATVAALTIDPPMSPSLMTAPLSEETMGQYIQSLKYKIDVAPMSFAYFCRATDDAMVGLKPRVARFTLDIHQRRKAAKDPELARVKSSWPLHHVEIQLEQMDMRVLHNVATSPASSSSASTTPVSDPQWPPFPWMDPDDWVDLDHRYPVKPQLVYALPFASSPFVAYNKQLDPTYIKKHTHLNTTHACIIGQAKSAKSQQQKQVHQRMAKIESLHRYHQQQLEIMENQLVRHGHSNDLHQKCNQTMELLQALDTRRRLLQRYIDSLDASNRHPQQASSLEQWELLMGQFKECYTIHQPHIIWTTAIHEVLHRWLEARAQAKINDYNISSRAVHALRTLIDQTLSFPACPSSTSSAKTSSASPNSAAPPQHDIQLNGNEHDLSVAQEWLNVLHGQTNFVQNETGRSHRDGQSDPSGFGHANDPQHQLSVIASDQVCDTVTLFDLWQPQVYLQTASLPPSPTPPPVSSAAPPRPENAMHPSHCTSRHLHEDDASVDQQHPGVLLVANHRVQVKQLTISEKDDPDVDTCLVKKRTVVSLDGLQLFVVQHGPHDRIEKLLDVDHFYQPMPCWSAPPWTPWDAFWTSPLDPCQAPSPCASARSSSPVSPRPRPDDAAATTLDSPWLPPELIALAVELQTRTDKDFRLPSLPCRFYLLDSNIVGTIQFDRYNPIRLAAATENPSSLRDRKKQQGALDDSSGFPCNTTTFHMAACTISADPYQYSVVSRVILDLVLARKVNKHLRGSKRLNDWLLSFHANGDSLPHVLAESIALQSYVRQQADHYHQLCTMDPSKRHQDALWQLSRRPSSLSASSPVSLLPNLSCPSAAPSPSGAVFSLGSADEALDSPSSPRPEDDLLWQSTMDQQRHRWHQAQDELRDMMQSVKYLLRKSANTHVSTTNQHDGSPPPLPALDPAPSDVQAADPLVPLEKIQVAIDSLVWNMLTAQGSPLSQWSVTGTRYVRMVYRNRNLLHTVDIDQLLVSDTSPCPAFEHVMAPYIRSDHRGKHKNKKKTRSGSSTHCTKNMIQARLESMPPVGSIPIIQHLEINLHPLHLQLSYAFWRTLLAYLFPEPLAASFAQQPALSPRLARSAPSTPTSPSNPALAMDLSASMSQPRRQGSWVSLSNQNSNPILLANPKTPSPDSACSPPTSAHDATGPSSFLPKRFSSHGKLPRLETAGLLRNQSMENVNDVAIMKQRAANYRSFILIKIPSVEHCLSFKGKRAIYNLDNFRFKQPSIEYHNKCISWYDLLQLLKKDFKRSVISHSPAFLKQKFTIQRRQRKQKSRQAPNDMKTVDRSVYNNPSQAVSGSSVISTDKHSMVTNHSSILSSAPGNECYDGINANASDGSQPATHHPRRPQPHRRRSSKTSLVLQTLIGSASSVAMDDSLVLDGDDWSDTDSSDSDDGLDSARYRDIAEDDSSRSSSSSSGHSFDRHRAHLDGREDEDEDDELDDDDDDLVSLHSDDADHAPSPTNKQHGFRRSFTRFFPKLGKNLEMEGAADNDRVSKGRLLFGKNYGS